MSGSKSSPFTQEQRRAYRQDKHAEAREQIEQACRELLTSEGWQRWAQTRATFHRYSLNNTMLIACQRPDATQVAGFRSWQQLGRQVRKGERAIRIMAPMAVKERDDAGSETGDRIMFFRAVPVFDIAQTDGEPLPQPPCEPITGDSHATMIGTLERFAESIGFTVGHAALEHGHGGYCDPEQRRIVVSSNLEAPNAIVRVLVHEIAHALGVGYRDYGRDVAEVIVETAAMIVCGSLGLDTAGESIPYIAGWGEDNDLAAIKEYAAKVDELAATIETACGVGRDGR